MATRKNTTTRSLKAKAARKRAKPARKRGAKLECPVKRLGHEQMKLIKALDYIEKKIKTAQGEEKADFEETREFIKDAIMANREAASFLEPFSNEGAMFLLLSVHTDVWDIAYTNDAETRGALVVRFN